MRRHCLCRQGHRILSSFLLATCTLRVDRLRLFLLPSSLLSLHEHGLDQLVLGARLNVLYVHR